jgi:hypothetical protein
MEDFFQQFIRLLDFRVDGPLKFRFIVQPLVALVLSTLDGIRDAKAGRHLYLLSLIREPATRMQYMKQGWRSIGKVFILAVILDIAFQVIFMGQLNIPGALLVGLVLALLPYLLLRGPVNYIARLILNRNKQDNA